MEYEWYPFDSHRCLIRAVQDKYGDYDIEYVTKVVKVSSIGMANKKLQYFIGYERLDPTEARPFKGYRGSAAGFAVILRRRVYPVILNLVCPTLIVTIISIISFKIPPDSVPGRMGLLVTCFLVIVNISGSHNEGINAGGISNAFTALDLWITVCEAVVSLGIVEYAFILNAVREGEFEVPLSRFCKARNKVNPKRSPGEVDINKECDKIDRACFRGLLTAFLAFASIYWAVVMIASRAYE